MSRQNYYKQRKVRQKRIVDESCVLELVCQQRKIQPKLGSRKLLHIIKPDLDSAGVMIGRDKFIEVLCRHDLLIKPKRFYARTTDSRHGMKVYENLLKDAVLTGPCQAFVSDITYIRTYAGFMYLALVMDAYSRAIVGYDCSDSLEAEGVLRALEMALSDPGLNPGLIHHSDRGSQYCSRVYTDILKDNGCRISMTVENHCYENSKAERLNGILKSEYGLDRCFLSKTEALESVAEAVMLYNYYRPHQSLGYSCPMKVHQAA